MTLLPCPFCGGSNIDPAGWASTERQGPACDDCAGTADTVELWNRRPHLEKLQGAVKETLRASGLNVLADKIVALHALVNEQTAGESNG